MYLNGGSAAGNLVEGNFIGTDAAGDNLGNGTGVYVIGATGNTIGGTTAAAANIIGFSSGPAIQLLSSSTSNLVEGNDIGTDAAGANLGNGTGVLINGVRGQHDRRDDRQRNRLQQRRRDRPGVVHVRPDRGELDWDRRRRAIGATRRGS